MLPAPPPLPLAAPDGTVYAYVCATCLRLATPGERVVPPGARPHAECVKIVGSMAQESLAEATACCRCRDCGEPLPARDLLHPLRRHCAGCKVRAEAAQAEATRRAADEAHKSRLAQEASLTLSRDPSAARDLLARMEEVSEEHCAATWLGNLEYILWDLLLRPFMLDGRPVDAPTAARTPLGCAPRYLGLAPLPPDVLARLHDLSRESGGWWRMGPGGALFVPIAQWSTLFSAHEVPK